MQVVVVLAVLRVPVACRDVPFRVLGKAGLTVDFDRGLDFVRGMVFHRRQRRFFQVQRRPAKPIIRRYHDVDPAKLRLHRALRISRFVAALDYHRLFGATENPWVLQINHGAHATFFRCFFPLDAARPAGV